MGLRFIDKNEAEGKLDWLALTDALAAGHQSPKGRISDVVQHRGDDTLLSRHAWIDGLGIAVKTCLIFPRNAGRGKPTINGLVTLYDDETGEASAALDFRLVTRWKTAADSLLAARRLARRDSRAILIIGAGTVAASMVEAYSALFHDAKFSIWNRTTSRAEDLAARFVDRDVRAVSDLATAVDAADVIATATMSREPVLRGAWLRPGQHVDLIGAYLPEMRETDDETMRRARVFVDCRESTLDEIGELIEPLRSGALSRDSVVADFYDLDSGRFARRDDDEITICKNGGGAHLDLMTSRYILDAVS